MTNRQTASIEESLRRAAVLDCARAIERDPSNKELYLERLRTYEPAARKHTQAQIELSETLNARGGM